MIIVIVTIDNIQEMRRNVKRGVEREKDKKGSPRGLPSVNKSSIRLVGDPLLGDADKFLGGAGHVMSLVVADAEHAVGPGVV